VAFLLSNRNNLYRGRGGGGAALVSDLLSRKSEVRFDVFGETLEEQVGFSAILKQR
jgi:hypothetical protein